MAAAVVLSGLLSAPFVVAGALESRQSNTTGIPSRVENGIQTECKSCPWSLCTNKVAYVYNTAMTLTCWTEGTEINGDNTWLKTQDGCYVTQWDIVEYAGDYTTDLPYCGAVPETITTGHSRTVYNTECNIIPEFVDPDDHVKMYKPEVDLTLTCYTRAGDAVLGNSMWYKTISNCYVPEAQIEYVDDGLDFCGDIPFMEKKMREPDPKPTQPQTRRASRATHKPKNKRWLYTTQIGDDSANCTTEAESSGDVVRTFPFGAYVIVQCATRSSKPADDGQIYLLTTDFCWINDTLTDPQLIDDTLRSERYPDCNLFVDTDS